jgi:hypothetical protein
MKLLTMDRSGEFWVQTYGRNHCGLDKDLQVRYRMLCECSTKLDARGFLFDQINVDAYFQSIKRSSLSCERLTMRSVKELVKAIKQENPVCCIHRMELTLSPAPFKASMTYRWAPNS